jgi:hypothetical protein
LQEGWLEFVTKQPLGIAHLRQYLAPNEATAMMLDQRTMQLISNKRARKESENVIEVKNDQENRDSINSYNKHDLPELDS